MKTMKMPVSKYFSLSKLLLFLRVDPPYFEIGTVTMDLYWSTGLIIIVNNIILVGAVIIFC